MVALVKVFGALSVLAGLIWLVFALYALLQVRPEGAPPALAMAAGFLLSGAVLLCFAAIVDHLAAIRRSLEGRPGA